MSDKANGPMGAPKCMNSTSTLLILIVGIGVNCQQLSTTIDNQSINLKFRSTVNNYVMYYIS